MTLLPVLCLRRLLLVLLCVASFSVHALAQSIVLDVRTVSRADQAEADALRDGGAAPESILGEAAREFAEDMAKVSTSGEHFCQQIRSDDLRAACLARYRGRDQCYMVRNDDLKFACLAQFQGRQTCFSIEDKDTRSSCLSDSDGEPSCYQIENKDDRIECLARFQGRDLCNGVREADARAYCFASN